MTVTVMILAIAAFGFGYPLLALGRRTRRRPEGPVSRWWSIDGGGDTWGGSEWAEAAASGEDGGDGGCDGGGGGDGGCD
jgi:hypothetical protein